MKANLSTLDWVVFPALVILFWSFGATKVDPLLLPSPWASFEALVDLARGGILWHELLISLRRVFLGVILGVVIGAPFGFAVARSRLCERWFGEAIPAVSATSSAIWAVFGILWFGLSDGATVFVVAMTAAPLLAVNTRDALFAVDPQLTELAETMGFGRLALTWKILLPEVAPSLFAGLRLAIGFGWRVGLVAEALGSPSGVGFQLKQAVDLMHTEEVFAWSVAVILVMVVLEVLLLRPIEARIFRWRKPARGEAVS